MAPLTVSRVATMPRAKPSSPACKPTTGIMIAKGGSGQTIIKPSSPSRPTSSAAPRPKAAVADRLPLAEMLGPKGSMTMRTPLTAQGPSWPDSSGVRLAKALT